MYCADQLFYLCSLADQLGTLFWLGLYVSEMKSMRTNNDSFVECGGKKRRSRFKAIFSASIFPLSLWDTPGILPPPQHFPQRDLNKTEAFTFYHRFPSPLDILF